MRGLAVACGLAGVIAATPVSERATQPSRDAPANRAGSRVETLRATSALPAHITGRFREPVGFQLGPGGRYYVFDRRAHTVYGVDPGFDTPIGLVSIGGEQGRILEPTAFGMDPSGSGSFVVADAPGSWQRVQQFDLQGLRIGGFTMPGSPTARVTFGPLVLNGIGSLQYTGQSVLINQPETGALITEYSMSGTVLRSFGALRRTSHESERDLHLALNVGLPLINPAGGFYFVFQTGVPLYRAYAQDGALRFERHIEGPELDSLVRSLPDEWPRRPDGEVPLMTPHVRTAAAERDGTLWVSLMPPYTYVYDRTGEKRRTVQFRAATGIIAPLSLSFAAAGRLLVAPGLFEFSTRAAPR
jgi:hypothetical protein